MRTLLISLLCLAPAFAAAQQAYQPRFARQQTSAQMLDFELCPKPEYPRSSLRNEEAGTVTLVFIVAPTGKTVSGSIARSSGFRELDRAAFNAMAKCRFSPASVDRVPVQGPALLQYVWILD